MIRSLVLAAALLAVLVTRIDAQTLAAIFDTATLGYAQSTVRTVEADGNPATVELLAVRHSDGAYSVGAVRTVGCAGPWFSPRAGLPVSVFSSIAVERVAGRDVLFVRDLSGAAIYVVSLHSPPCQ